MMNIGFTHDNLNMQYIYIYIFSDIKENISVRRKIFFAYAFCPLMYFVKANIRILFCNVYL